ncbi:MAG: hypothetical protein EXS03_06935 [Phycisphaerales bacterium]|nr:hypothetical protein [Phycisphaerales bacterium]
MKAWVNGAFVAVEDAKVSLFDSGLQHGIGLFETMVASQGKVHRLMDHLRRLKASATELRLTDELHLGPLAKAVESTLDENSLEAARIRVTVTGGDLMLSPSAQTKGVRHDPTIAIVAQTLTNYPEELFEKGVRVRVASLRVNPLDAFAGHKTIWYWPRLSELQAAAAAGCSESIHFTVANRLASGSVSNVFLIKDGRLRTPMARGEGEPSAVLPGITRAAVMEIARAQSLVVETSATLSIDDLLGSDEVFLTNSSFGILPVVHVEATPIGSGAVGALTQALRGAYTEMVDDEALGAPLP